MDTSVLNLTYEKYNNFYYFQTRKLFYEFVKFIKDNNELKHIKILIPRIVIEELKKHQIDAFNKCVQTINENILKFQDFSFFKLETPEIDYEKHLNQKIGNYISMYDVGIIEIPNKDLTQKLIQKAVNKERPFYKTAGKDSGFKDAVIWESILEYGIQHKDEHLLFLHNDNDFIDNKLSGEFKELTGNQIISYKNPAEIKSFLDKEFELHQKLNELISSLNKDFYNTIYNYLVNKYHYININPQQFDIRSFRVGDEINNISFNQENGDYSLEVPFTTFHSTPYSGYSIIDNDYAPFEESFYNNIIKVTLKRVGGNFVYKNFELFTKNLQ